MNDGKQVCQNAFQLKINLVSNVVVTGRIFKKEYLTHSL